MTTSHKPLNAGFTLIEYLVASGLSMVIMAATFMILGQAFKVNSSMGDVMATQQNVRVAMNTMSRDITMAGTGMPGGGIVVPNGTNSAVLTRPGLGGTLSTDNDVMPILSPGNDEGPTLSSVKTDALSIVSVDQDSPVWQVDTVDSTGTLVTFVQDIRSGATQIQPGTLLFFVNANGAVFGFVTDVSKTASEATFADKDAMNINQPDAADGNLKSLINSNGTWPPTTATRVNIVSYYISNAVPAHPRLMRSVNAETPQVTVEDIDNLQFSFDLFDFATNANTANQATTASPNQIRSVNISITGRSPSILQTLKDYYRFGLVSKVNVRNATFRNRYS